MFRHFFSKGLWAGVLFIMIALAYIPAMRGGFIWDDDSYVTLNPTLKTVDGLRKIWFDPAATPQYYPLVFTSFWAQYQLWETKPFFYHFVNVLLHALNAVLLWRILLRLRVNGAWMAAAIFALHPVHLESVGWITERKNVLSGFFYLYALLIYLRFSLLDDHLSSNPAVAGLNLQASAIQSRSPGLFLIVMGLFACALLSKTVTCTLPAVILLLLWWKRGRVRWRDVWPLIPLFILGAGFATVTMGILGCRALPYSGEGTVVLCRKAHLAFSDCFHISSLADRFRDLVAISVPLDGLGRSWVLMAYTKAKGKRAPGGGIGFWGYAGAGLGICQLLPHAFFLCG
jgi:hypothetical protein